MASRKPKAVAIQDQEAIKAITNRLKRAEGQIAGVVKMIEEGRSCQDVVTQLAAVSKAVDRAAFALISTGLRECLLEGGSSQDEVAEQMEKLFLTIA